MYAIEEGSKDALEALVTAGVDVNQADEVLEIKIVCLKLLSSSSYPPPLISSTQGQIA